MTVTTTTNTATHTGNGVTTEFTFAFIVLDAAHLSIQRKIIATGVVDKIYLPSEYTVVGIDNPAGGTITILGTPLASTYQLIIQRVVPNTQPLDLINQSGFFPNTIEEQLDNIVMQVQQLANVGPLDDAGALQLSLAQASGAGLVGYSGKTELSGEQASNVERKLRETISVWEYLTAAELADVLGATFAVDVTSAIQKAFDDLRTGVIGGLYFPDGGYKITAAITANAASMFGWHVYGQSRGKTIIKQFTNNTAIFQFTVDNMHSIDWHTMTLAWNTTQTGNTSSAAFKVLNGGATKSLYASNFRELSITNCYWAIDASAALWWGNTFEALITTQGGAFKVNGSAGQPRCRFAALVTGGASGIYTAQCNAMYANWNLEILNSSGPAISEGGGGVHHLENFNWESGTVVAGNVFMFDFQNSKLTATGPLTFLSVTLAAAAIAFIFNSTAAVGLINILTKPSVTFSGAGISAQGAGSKWNWFGRGDANMPSLQQAEDIDSPWTASGVTPACQLTDVGSSATADFVKVRSWTDKGRTALMGDANITTAFNGAGRIISNIPRTATRKIITPYASTANGCNLFGDWEREVLVMPQATGAFAIDIRDAGDTTTIFSIPGNVFGRWLIRWDRQAVRSGDAIATMKVFYLGPIQQDTGWTVGTGTQLKGAFAAYGGTTHTGAYVQASVQAADDAAKNASQRVLALEVALRAAGLIRA